MAANRSAPAAESVHRAEVAWCGTKQDLRAHEVRLAGGQTVRGSSASTHGGDPEASDPEELFVASISSCHMLWFIAQARGERIRVTSYEDRAEGTMDERGFTRVVLRPSIEFEGEVDDETRRRLHHEAHQRCYIANSVSCPVEVEER